ncbi:endonuclease [Anopheles sinensis]|uniref:Endonuclease n=1 Tax=Anopheles sinensis TaxID=74873 RepID=A0A084WUA5_ANOSI|nr:endonuclease [Anopheles sinensis]
MDPFPVESSEADPFRCPKGSSLDTVRLCRETGWWGTWVTICPVFGCPFARPMIFVDHAARSARQTGHVIVRKRMSDFKWPDSNPARYE